MVILEQNITGKHTQEDCEDGIVVTDDFIAVIDGSTSKSNKRISQVMSNGKYCMTVVADFISKMPSTITLDEFCNGITQRIHSLYPADDSHLLAHPEDRLCASAIIYSNHHKEIWMIGDCQCLVGNKLYSNDKPSEKALAGQRAAVFGKMLDNHDDMLSPDGAIAHDYARDSIIPGLIASMQDENKAYAVIDGFPIYKDGIKVIHKPDGQDCDIVLASDGYPFLCQSLDKSEKKLARQLATDPYNTKAFKATKGLMAGNVSFDDRAFIRFSTAGFQRYFLNISFDGTAYHGWQIQPNGMSVQERLQDSLSKILRHKIEVTGAGRTDAGVHAQVMVCHFDYAGGIDCHQLAYRLNNILPQDISCNSVRPVGQGLHARFSATRRTYRYFIHTNKSPFMRHYSVETHYDLDFDLMNKAAGWLTSVADFKAFCKAGADNKTTLCRLDKAQWVQASPTSWYFEIAADRFLRNMVRAVVGTLFEVGRHRITIDQFKQIVTYGSRSDSGESMPAHGLFLWDIEYPAQQ